ncbi:MAG: hypothetical protein U0871_07130 [Gemmataceae bacterium]
MTAFEVLKRAADRQVHRMRRDRDRALRHLDEGMSLQEELAWDLLLRIALLDPSSLVFGQLRMGLEVWGCRIKADGRPVCSNEVFFERGQVALVRVPVPRKWSPLWVAYTPTGLILAKYNPLDSFCSLPYADPCLFGVLEAVLARLGLPVQLDT